MQGHENQVGLFVRLPNAQAQLLDRASAAVPAPKKDLIAGLLARHVDPDSPEGLAALREIAEPWARSPRRIIIEGEERPFQTGFGAFSPSAPREVLDPEAAAQLLDVDVATLLELAERGDIPGRKLGEHWRFARQGLLDWLART
jgi:excisionase family DNA binding protein